MTRNQSKVGPTNVLTQATELVTTTKNFFSQIGVEIFQGILKILPETITSAGTVYVKSQGIEMIGKQLENFITSMFKLLHTLVDGIISLLYYVTTVVFVWVVIPKPRLFSLKESSKDQPEKTEKSTKEPIQSTPEPKAKPTTATKETSPPKNTASEPKQTTKSLDLKSISTPIDLLMLYSHPKAIPLAAIDYLAGRQLIPSFEEVKSLNGNAVVKLLACMLTLFVSHQFVHTQKNQITYPTLFVKVAMWLHANQDTEMNFEGRSGEMLKVPLAVVMSETLSMISNVLLPETVVQGFLQKTKTAVAASAARRVSSLTISTRVLTRMLLLISITSRARSPRATRASSRS